MGGKSGEKGEGEGKEPIVLVVDDVQSNRTLISTILKMNGYEVLEAKDQEEALKVSEDHHGPIDLLVADLVLPKANGIQVAHSLRPMRIFPRRAAASALALALVMGVGATPVAAVDPAPSPDVTDASASPPTVHAEMLAEYEALDRAFVPGGRPHP